MIPVGYLSISFNRLFCIIIIFFYCHRGYRLPREPRTGNPATTPPLYGYFSRKEKIVKKFKNCKKNSKIYENSPSLHEHRLCRYIAE